MANSMLMKSPSMQERPAKKRSFPRKPELLSIWGKGQLLAFSGIDGATDSQNALYLRTCGDMAALEIRLPADAGTLVFDEQCPEQVYLASDHFTLRLADGSVVRGAFADCHHILIEGAGNLVGNSDDLQILSEGKRMLLGVRAFFEPALLKCDFNRLYRERAEFLNNCTYPYDISRQSRKTLARAYSMVKNQIYSPEGQIKHRWSSPDRWPHRWMWLWDSAFHAIGIRHIDPKLSRDCLSAVFDCQHEDGFIPHCMTPQGGSEITQPPVLGLGIKLVMETDADLNWLRDIYPRQAAFLKWVIANRDADGAGLVEWKLEDDVNCRSGESGMDNSPRFDGAPLLDATDFNAYLAADCEYTAELAEMLGYKEDASFWRKEYKRINALINKRLWSDQHEFYVDYDIESGKQSDILSSAGFLPLISGAPNKKQAQKLVKHLSNPETFGTPFGVPSIARNCKLYSKDMWRGPVWISVNYLITLGLERYGYMEEATNLREATLREIERFYLEYGTIFEYYDDRRTVAPPDLLRKGKNLKSGNPYHQVLHDFGWSATLYIEMLFHKKIFTGNTTIKSED